MFVFVRQRQTFGRHHHALWGITAGTFHYSLAFCREIINKNLKVTKKLQLYIHGYFR